MGAASPSEYFLKPGLFARLLNKAVGASARLGIGPSYIHLLKVRGRRTGRVFSTPVNLLEYRGRYYLVGGRGHTGWSKNAAGLGAVELVRGRHTRRYRAVPLDDESKPEILKTYLDTYSYTVQKFFAVPAGAPVEAFQKIADRHPVFELFES